jgi:hypothetical protein
MYQAGVERRNYVLFSALSSEGLAEARTVGAFGLVLGPHLNEYRCPADIELEEVREAVPLKDIDWKKGFDGNE